MVVWQRFLLHLMPRTTQQERALYFEIASGFADELDVLGFMDLRQVRKLLLRTIIGLYDSSTLKYVFFWRGLSKQQHPVLVGLACRVSLARKSVRYGATERWIDRSCPRCFHWPGGGCASASFAQGNSCLLILSCRLGPVCLGAELLVRERYREGGAAPKVGENADVADVAAEAHGSDAAVEVLEAHRRDRRAPWCVSNLSRKCVTFVICLSLAHSLVLITVESAALKLSLSMTRCAFRCTVVAQ